MTNSKISKTSIKSATKKKPLTIHNKKLYRIVWRDAFSEVDEWHQEGFLKGEDYLCETVGFLIEDNGRPNYYTIASTITNDEMFCSVMNIPKSMVVKKTLLRMNNQ